MWLRRERFGFALMVSGIVTVVEAVVFLGLGLPPVVCALIASGGFTTVAVGAILARP
jgi:hypothetical protein